MVQQVHLMQLSVPHVHLSVQHVQHIIQHVLGCHVDVGQVLFTWSAYTGYMGIQFGELLTAAALLKVVQFSKEAPGKLIHQRNKGL